MADTSSSSGAYSQTVAIPTYRVEPKRAETAQPPVATTGATSAAVTAAPIKPTDKEVAQKQAEQANLQSQIDAQQQQQVLHQAKTGSPFVTKALLSQTALLSYANSNSKAKDIYENNPHLASGVTFKKKDGAGAGVDAAAILTGGRPRFVKGNSDTESVDPDEDNGQTVSNEKSPSIFDKAAMLVGLKPKPSLFSPGNKETATLVPKEEDMMPVYDEADDGIQRDPLAQFVVNDSDDKLLNGVKSIAAFALYKQSQSLNDNPPDSDWQLDAALNEEISAKHFAARFAAV